MPLEKKFTKYASNKMIVCWGAECFKIFSPCRLLSLLSNFAYVTDFECQGQNGQRMAEVTRGRSILTVVKFILNEIASEL